MWYVECQYADKDHSIDKWVGLTEEQAKDIHSRLSGWQSEKLTRYVRSGKMKLEC